MPRRRRPSGDRRHTPAQGGGRQHAGATGRESTTTATVPAASSVTTAAAPTILGARTDGRTTAVTQVVATGVAQIAAATDAQKMINGNACSTPAAPRARRTSTQQSHVR